MKRLTPILSVGLIALALLTGCGKSNPDAPYFKLSNEERSKLEQQVEEVKTKISTAGTSENGDNYLLLAELHMRLSDYKNALEDYKKAETYQPKSAMIHSNLSTVYEYLGEYDESLDEIDTAIKLDSKFAPFYLTKIRLLRFKFEQSSDEMAQTYKDSIAATNGDTGIFLAAAEHYALEGQNEKNSTKIQQALAFYRQSIAKKPDNQSIVDKIDELEKLLETLEIK